MSGRLAISRDGVLDAADLGPGLLSDVEQRIRSV
jgi:hypothetical protein